MVHIMNENVIDFPVDKKKETDTVASQFIALVFEQFIKDPLIQFIDSKTITLDTSDEEHVKVHWKYDESKVSLWLEEILSSLEKGKETHFAKR